MKMQIVDSQYGNKHSVKEEIEISIFSWEYSPIPMPKFLQKLN